MDKPEKAELQSMNVAADKRWQLAQLFPEVVTETRTEDGQLVPAVDFEKLKGVLGEFSEVLENQRERYGMTWPGKDECLKIIQQPSVAALKPCREESVNFDETENVFIEGDNLEVLKLLQKAYYGRVKMIYIDPPYNTGNDFIYPDDYSETLETYLAYTGQIDDEGRKFSTNTESEGRYHSKWLRMMFPRLYLARNLLSPNGLLFVSIDDHEASNLRKMCDEIFGEECFVAQFVWNTEGHTDNQYDVKVNHEYVLLYARTPGTPLGHVIDPNTRDESNLWKGYAENSITKNGRANPPSEVELPAGFPVKVDSLDLSPSRPTPEFFEQIKRVGYITRELTKVHNVTYPIRLDQMKASEGKLSTACCVYSGWANVNKLQAFIDGGCEPIIEDGGDVLTFYLSERGVLYYRRDRDKARHVVSVLRNMGTTEQMSSYLERLGIHFQYPKPKDLLKYLLQVGFDGSATVMDFFAGSGTLAQAVLEVNNEDDRAIRFLNVQLPEAIDEGELRTLSALAQARISRVCDGLRAASGDLLTERSHAPDLGFRVFKLDRSNFRLWEGSQPGDDPEKIARQLELHEQHLNPNATPEDILYELLLKAGFPLTTKVEKVKMAGKEVFSIAEGTLLICLQDEITKELIKTMADANPLQVICLDSGFKNNDQLKANAVQTFKVRNRGKDKESSIVLHTV